MAVSLTTRLRCYFSKHLKGSLGSQAGHFRGNWKAFPLPGPRQGLVRVQLPWVPQASTLPVPRTSGWQAQQSCGVLLLDTRLRKAFQGADHLKEGVMQLCCDHWDPCGSPAGRRQTFQAVRGWLKLCKLTAWLQNRSDPLRSPPLWAGL